MANRIILTGRLTRDPELKTLQSGAEVCNFSIAVNRRIKRDNQPTADFFDCIAFGKTANFITRWFKKGAMIYVEGSVQNRTWDDADGRKHSKFEIIVDNAEFCGSKSESSGTATATPTEASGIESIVVTDEDLPF